MTKATKITIGISAGIIAAAVALWYSKAFWMWMVLQKWPEQTAKDGITMASREDYSLDDTRTLYFSGHPSWFPELWTPVAQAVPEDSPNAGTF